ncbi:MAG: hypothetical protein C4576_12345 [Desulfobacteraceae bacterium]|nr:MAG: hypothetical protein C4576_12345 [Desulfobacteraceae bacterium]
MYSPKIRDDLIPRIYHVAKGAKVPMTRWVNQILERALADHGCPEAVASDQQTSTVEREGGLP